MIIFCSLLQTGCFETHFHLYIRSYISARCRFVLCFSCSTGGFIQENASPLVLPLPETFVCLNRFPGCVTDHRKRFYAACSITLFTFGFLPIRKGYTAQSVTVQAFTSDSCQQQQSRHLFLIARTGVSVRVSVPAFVL